MVLLATRPDIEVYDSHLKLRSQAIPWAQIRRLDRQASLPLVMKLTLADKRQLRLVYAGEPGQAQNLLRHLRRYAREALIDGISYRQFWGELQPSTPDRRAEARAQRETHRETQREPEKLEAPAPARYPLLLEEDEAEIERMFQRLKAVGHLDSKSGEEK